MCAGAGIRAKSQVVVPQLQKLQIDKLPAVVDAAEKNLVAAAQFLRDRMRVCSNRLLPYSFQLVMLAEYFQHCTTPDPQQLAVLERWFWSTSLSGWFAGANSRALNRGLDEIREFARGTLKEFTVMPLDGAVQPFPRRFDGRGARVRAVMLMMLSRQPLDTHGDPIDVASLMKERGGEAMSYVYPRSVGLFVSSPGNRIMMAREPGTSMAVQLRNIAPQLRDKVLHSHWVSADAQAALRRDEGSRFIRVARCLPRGKGAEFIAELGLEPPSTEADITDEPDTDADD